MSLRARVAVYTFVVALLTSGTLTLLFARDTAQARLQRLRAEGRRVAFSAVTLYDVLRLTGSDADRATLQAFLKSAVRGTSNEDALGYAVVLDDKGVVVAGDATIASIADVAAGRVMPDVLAVDAAVVARDSAHKAPDAPAGRVLVGLSTKPAQAALVRTIATAGALSGAISLAFAALLAFVVTRRVVRPLAAVGDAMARVKAGDLDVVVPDSGGTDEAARLIDGFNDMVSALVGAGHVKSALDRRVGKKAAGFALGVVGHGRRARVTALALEVEGFTDRATRDAPELVVAFLNELVGECIRIIDAHDGHVASLRGGALLALFGLPEPKADDAERAVRAAVALQARCKELSEERRKAKAEPFAVGIGVAGGEVVLATVGNEDRAEDVVVGEPVAVALGIEAEARATGFGVLVADETFRALPPEFEGAATPPVLVKGIGVPLTLYRVRERPR